MKFIIRLILVFSCLIKIVFALPLGFVYLKDVDPTIQQDIRYAGSHNFIGRPIHGYEAAECILTLQAAEAIAKVQQELRQTGLSLKVYDCYRPQSAVDYFINWGEDLKDQKMKKEFYPNINKNNIFKLGYVAKNSGHSRGSQVDLTIVFPSCVKSSSYKVGDKLSSCASDYTTRYFDNSIDMGTGYDCMDTLSHADNKKISLISQSNRLLLRELMQKNGFTQYQYEWWHFSYKEEPFAHTYFNFPIVEKN